MVVSFGSDFFSYNCSQWADLGASYPLIDDRSSEIWKLFGNGTVPRNVILDSNGKVHYSRIGYNEADVIALLDQLLSTQSTAPVQTPGSAQLLAAYPNPFNAGTQIQFELDRTRPIQLLIFDQKGHIVKTVMTGLRSQGQYSVQWNGQNDAGNDMPSGVYMVTLITESTRSSQKIILLK